MRLFVLLLALIASTLATPVVLDVDEPTLVARGVSKTSSPKVFILKSAASCHESASFSSPEKTLADNSITAKCYVFGDSWSPGPTIQKADGYQTKEIVVYRSWAYVESGNCYIFETLLDTGRKWKSGLKKC